MLLNKLYYSNEYKKVEYSWCWANLLYTKVTEKVMRAVSIQNADKDVDAKLYAFKMHKSLNMGIKIIFAGGKCTWGIKMVWLRNVGICGKRDEDDLNLPTQH